MIHNYDTEISMCGTSTVARLLHHSCNQPFPSLGSGKISVYLMQFKEFRVGMDEELRRKNRIIVIDLMFACRP